MEQRHFCQASLEYVFLLQEVQERKKFEFVETVSGFYFYKRLSIKHLIIQKIYHIFENELLF